MKRNKNAILSSLLVFCLMLSLLSAGVMAGETEQEPVTYLDASWNGSEVVRIARTATEYLEVTADTTEFLDGKTYVAKGRVSHSPRIECGSGVKLILTDGCKLEITNGVHLSETGSLSIYGQEKDNGELSMSNKHENYRYCLSALGRDEDESGGAVCIYGGQITAITRGYSFGGICADDIDIFGGNIEAQGYVGAAIGSVCGTVTIYDGIIRAEGDIGAAIGGAEKSTGGSVNIYGGDITAESGSGAAIGGGCNGSFDFVNIFGGYIDAETWYSAVIGSAQGGSCDRVGLYGGNIQGNSKEATAFCGENSSIRKSSMPDVLLGEGFGIGYGKTWVEAYDDSLYLMGSTSTKRVQSALKDAKYIRSTSWNYVDHIQQSDGTVIPVERVAYVHFPVNDNTTLMDADQHEVCYLRLNVTLKERLNVKGNVKLILGPNCVLDAPKGIHVGENSSLTIYSEEKGGQGRLIAAYDGDEAYSAIGSNGDEDAGAIIIHGGIVEARSTYGAGIGGTSNHEGIITIYDGTVTGSSDMGAGIAGNVTIHGGTVTGTSIQGAGIGSGAYAFGGNVTITGGTVTAKSASGAGIGSGIGLPAWTPLIRTNGGSVTIRGGQVSASSETGSAIGGGENSNPASVTLGSGVTLAYGENAEKTRSTVSEASGTPSEVGKTLGAARFVQTGEENGNEVVASVFSEDSVSVIIGCCALLVGLFLGILIGRKTGAASRGKNEET